MKFGQIIAYLWFAQYDATRGSPSRRVRDHTINRGSFSVLVVSA
jgi:hypothetical protein